MVGDGSFGGFVRFLFSKAYITPQEKSASEITYTHTPNDGAYIEALTKDPATAANVVSIPTNKDIKPREAATIATNLANKGHGNTPVVTFSSKSGSGTEVLTCSEITDC